MGINILSKEQEIQWNEDKIRYSAVVVYSFFVLLCLMTSDFDKVMAKRGETIIPIYFRSISFT